MTFFALFVASLATARATRLIVDDTIGDRPRLWLIRNAPKIIVSLFTCPWCISGWIALAATITADAFYDVPLPALWWFACWQVACTAYWLTETLGRWGDDA